MNPLYLAEKFAPYTSSADAFAAVDERYTASMLGATIETWAANLGDVVPTDEMAIRFPVASLSGWGYQQYQGENRFRSYSGKDFVLKTEEFQEGYEEYLRKLQKDPLAARQWALWGERLPMMETDLVNSTIGAALVAGTTTNGIDGAAFFSAAHGNYQSAATPFNIANLITEAGLMASQTDGNGRTLGVKADTILTSNGLFFPATLAVSQALMSSGGVAVDNPFKGAFAVVSANNLPNAGTPGNSDWYLIDSTMVSKGLPPWVIVRGTGATTGEGSATGLRRWDTDTDFFKNHSRIRVSSHIDYGFSLGFHPGIRKIKGAV